MKDVFWLFNWEATTPNYEKMLRIGLNGMLEEVRQRQVRLGEEYLAKEMNGIDYVKKRDALDSMTIALEAVIADICEAVPANPARTFQEALQCYWFIHLVVNFIDLPQVGSGIRFDQVLYPYYEQDVAAAGLDRDQA